MALTPPSSNASTASVATIGLMLTRATKTPFNAPKKAVMATVTMIGTKIVPVRLATTASINPAIVIMLPADISSPR